MAKIKVLFVCLGNICRSPLAEAIFKTRISELGLISRIEADSCGTAGYHIGDKPDPRTIANARKNGIEIRHVGRQLSLRDIEQYDFIVAMDRSNYQNILNVRGAEHHREKIALMRDFDARCDHEDVPDPYYGGEQLFQEVFEILDRSTSSLVDHLKNKHLKV
jgi:protein-tyrosine phosphatase